MDYSTSDFKEFCALLFIFVFVSALQFTGKLNVFHVLSDAKKEE